MAIRKSSSDTMLYLSKTARVRCPEIAIATRSGTPARKEEQDRHDSILRSLTLSMSRLTYRRRVPLFFRLHNVFIALLLHLLNFLLCLLRSPLLRRRPSSQRWPVS